MFNAAKYAKRCIDSIKAQTLSSFECIVIDDGSIDNSFSLVQSMCKSDKRFKLFKQKNSGAPAARNNGIDMACGEWLTFCDIDDWMEKDRLEIAYNAAVDNNVQIVWNGMNIWQNGRIVGKWHTNVAGIYSTDQSVILSSKKYDIGHTPNKLYRMSLVKDNSIRFPNIKMSEDLLFNIEAYFRAGKILSINNCLYNYDRHTSSLSMASRDKQSFVMLYSEFLKLQQRLKDINTFKNNIGTIDNFLKSIFVKC